MTKRSPTPFDLMTRAIKKDDIELMKRIILANTLDIDYCADTKNHTLLHQAVWFGSANAFKLLLDLGADIEARTHTIINGRNCFLTVPEYVEHVHKNNLEIQKPLTELLLKKAIEEEKNFLGFSVVSFPSNNDIENCVQNDTESATTKEKLAKKRM